MNTAALPWHRRTASGMLRMAAWLVVLNAPFWILGRGAFVSRALFSLDSLLALLVCQFSAGLGLGLVALSWLCDLVWSTSISFHFASPLTFVRSFRYAGTLDPWPYLTSPLIVYALPFALAMAAAAKLATRRIGMAPIAASMLALMALDVANGSSALSHVSVRLSGANVAGSSLYALASAVHGDEVTDTLAPVPGGTHEFDALAPGAVDADGGILYVIVESMGEHRSAQARSWLMAQLAPDGVSTRYHVRSGTLSFKGGTPDGELRRLCGLAGSYRRVDTAAGRDCLPSALAARGWHTAGFHGFSEKMFDRARWWPLIGLQDMYFAEQLSPLYADRCGAAFKGLCDADVLQAAARRASQRRGFAYVLTLNSHLPLEPTPIAADLARLCSAEGMTAGACTLFARNALVLRAIAATLSAGPRISTVVVVGDHAPPFADLPSRGQFVGDRVPYYVLTAAIPPQPR